MKFYNVHRVRWHEMAGCLNGHAERGWTLQNISAIGQGDRVVTFVREFDTDDAKQDYLAARAKRKVQQQKEVPCATGVDTTTTSPSSVPSAQPGAVAAS